MNRGWTQVFASNRDYSMIYVWDLARTKSHIVSEIRVWLDDVERDGFVVIPHGQHTWIVVLAEHVATEGV